MLKTNKLAFGCTAVGLVYGVVLLGFGVSAAGAGHGTYVLLGLFSSPVGIIWLVGARLDSGSFLTALGALVCFLSVPVQWAAFFALASLSTARTMARVFLTLTATHYVVAALLLTSEPFGDWSYFPRRGAIATAGFVAYLIGQACLWLVFVGARRRRPALPPN